MTRAGTLHPLPPPRPRLPDVFESLAYLFRPANGTIRTEIQEADAGWSAPIVLPEVDVMLWGRIATNARPSLGSIPTAMAREATIARLRAARFEAMHLAELHRLPAVRRPGRFRGPIRDALLGGLIAELVRGARPTRVIDEVVAAAGATSLGGGLRPSGDGSALATLPMSAEEQAELRVARVGHPKAAQRGYAALEVLRAAGVDRVPHPLGRGETAGASWALESGLPGRHTLRASGVLIADIGDLLLRLPQASGGPSATDEHLADVCRAFPAYADELQAVSAAVARWSSGMPSVLVHGDLWLNNVLVADGRLSGVFDWDTWHPAGLPGTDLLNVLAAQERTRSRRDIGPLLMAGHWRSPDVVEVLRPHLAARGVGTLDASALAAIGVAWWASRVAAALDRGGRPTEDPAWVERNLVAPLTDLERLQRELG